MVKRLDAYEITEDADGLVVWFEDYEILLKALAAIVDAHDNTDHWSGSTKKLQETIEAARPFVTAPAPDAQSSPADAGSPEP